MPVPLRKKKLGRGEGKFGIEARQFPSKKVTVVEGVTFRTERRAKQIVKDFKAQANDKTQSPKIRKRRRESKIRVVRFK